MAIKRSLIITCIVLAGAFGSIGTASARECKSEAITAEGPVAKLRDLGAYPASLFAWRKAVADKLGAEWNSWRYAQNAKVDCQQITSGDQKGWKCTRTANPCQDTVATVVDKAQNKKECKPEPLSSTGARKNTEDAAVEESKGSWRIDAKKKYGAEWAKLDNSDNPDQDCRKIGSKYQCITVATACKPN
jgi:hypothetical protein